MPLRAAYVLSPANTRQFTQQDTYHWDNYAMNLYGYCSADPVNNIDPSGHWAVGNQVQVHGYGTANSYGGGAQTQSYNGETLTIAKMVSGNGRTRLYGLSRNGGTGSENVIGWFEESQFTGGGSAPASAPAQAQPTSIQAQTPSTATPTTAPNNPGSATSAPKSAPKTSKINIDLLKKASWLYSVAEFSGISLESGGIWSSDFDSKWDSFVYHAEIEVGYAINGSGSVTVSKNSVLTELCGNLELSVSLSRTTIAFSKTFGNYKLSYYASSTWTNMYYGISLSYEPTSGPYVTLSLEYGYNRLTMAARAAVAAGAIFAPAAVASAGPAGAAIIEWLLNPGASPVPAWAR